MIQRIFFFCLIAFTSCLTANQVIQLSSPLEYQVIQRNSPYFGRVIFKGKLSQAAGEGTWLEARHGDEDWREIGDVEMGQANFEAEYRVDQGGWHRVELRAMTAKGEIGKTAVEHLGIGEVFVIAGQSNSANHGEKKQNITSGLVSTFDGKSWRIAHDPQPGASGGGGSFIPSFADAMAKKFEVPIGIVSTGVGATSVREWLPKGSRFLNPPTIMNKVVSHPKGGWMSKGDVYENFISRVKPLGRYGFRAVLWHQGESDANQKDTSRTLKGELYQEYLAKLIEATRNDVDWKCPWFVAQASYHTPDDTGSPDIRAAQKALWDSGVALEGPDTDKLDGDHRDNGGKGVHFSEKGLKAHGSAWAAKVSPWLTGQLERKHIIVYLLAGQSNMQGQGVVSMDHEKYYNGGKGNLVWSMEHSASKGKMKHLRDADGKWVVRDQVQISFKQKEKVRKGPLTVGFTGYGGSSHIGPELQFGHVVGDHHDDCDILLIKTAWGGKSLFKDFRPPSAGGETGEYYKMMIAEIRTELAKMAPDTYDIGGFVWMQGWNDMVSREATAEYAVNLIHLVADIRKEFKNESLPIVVGELGNGGEAKPGSGMALFRQAQKEAVENIEFAAFVSTKEFARPAELSPNTGHGHHWFGNAESYFLVGDALARRLTEVLAAIPN